MENITPQAAAMTLAGAAFDSRAESTANIKKPPR